MITLGLVDSVDDNGVYVTMPGSKGVLRGPYKALSTVAAGTTVLVASTDDGEQVVVGPSPAGDGVVSVLSYGAVGDGVTDDTAALQAALDAAAGMTLVFPSNHTFLISDSLTPSEGTTIFGYGAAIKHTKKYPVFDIIMTDRVTIAGLRFVTEIARVYAAESPAAEYRLNDQYTMWAGVLASGDQLTVRDCSFEGFTAGISLYTWDGTDRSGTCTRPRIDNILVEDCDFGVLVESVDDGHITGVRGSVTRQSGCPNPPHLIYLSHGYLRPNNTRLLVRDVHCWGCESWALQCGFTDDSTIDGVQADACGGVMSIGDCSRTTVSNLSATNDVTPSAGSLYMAEDLYDITVNNVTITSESPTPASARAGRISGQRTTASNLTSRFDWDAEYGTAEWVIDDASSVSVEAVTSLNASTYGVYAVYLGTTAADVNVTDVTAINCKGGVKCDTGSTGVVDVNTDQIVYGSGIAYPAKVIPATGVKVYLRGGQPAVTGSRSGNAALASLLTTLEDLGIITDSSS